MKYNEYLCSYPYQQDFQSSSMDSVPSRCTSLTCPHLPQLTCCAWPGIAAGKLFSVPGPTVGDHFDVTGGFMAQSFSWYASAPQKTEKHSETALWILTCIIMIEYAMYSKCNENSLRFEKTKIQIFHVRFPPQCRHSCKPGRARGWFICATLGLSWVSGRLPWQLWWATSDLLIDG